MYISHALDSKCKKEWSRKWCKNDGICLLLCNKICIHVMEEKLYGKNIIVANEDCSKSMNGL